MRTLFLAALLSLAGCAHPVTAGSLVDVTVVNRVTGERLTPYRHAGKLWVAGTPGQHYAVEIANRGPGRVLAVLSVDGVNAVTGETAATSQNGYVLDGWRSYAVNGWRKNLDEVARFEFTSLGESYAARTGRPGHVGVIGVAVFREKPQPVPVQPEVDLRPGRREAPAAESAPAAPSAAGRAADAAKALGSEAGPATRERLGTGHGARESSVVSETRFERASSAPDEIVTLYYDSRENLVARGIIPTRRPPAPRPFPGGIGFVPDPA